MKNVFKFNNIILGLMGLGIIANVASFVLPQPVPSITAVASVVIAIIALFAGVDDKDRRRIVHIVLFTVLIITAMFAARSTNVINNQKEAHHEAVLREKHKEHDRKESQLRFNHAVDEKVQQRMDEMKSK